MSNLNITKKISRASAKKEEKQLRQIKSAEFNDTKMLSSQEISVLLFYQQRQNTIQELLPNQTVYINSNDQIQLGRLIQSLKRESFFVHQYCLSYQDPQRGVFIYCGDTSKKQYINIPLKYVNKNKQLKLKIRRNKKSLVQNLLDQQKRNTDKQAQTDKTGTKTKQKRIGEVIEKVALWRRFYTGFYDQKGNFIQKPLQQAASQVGIAKKTLDDYLLQIRCGKKYGFNFNQNVNGKIGQLRAFVRQSKKKDNKD